MNDQLDMLDHAKRTALDLAMRFGPKLMVAIAVMIVGGYVGGWAGRAADRWLSSHGFEPPVRRLTAQVARLLVLLLFAIVALQNLGIELLPLIAGLSVAGAGIALALQGVFGNLAAGLTIIFTRPFREGDYIGIVGEEGLVENITLFDTILLHADQSQVVIPNRKIVGEILHNYGRIRQLDLVLPVAYDADLALVRGAVDEVLRAQPLVLATPAPLVGISAFDPGALKLAVKPWIAAADYATAGGAISAELLAALRARGVAMPIPRTDVKLVQNAP